MRWMDQPPLCPLGEEIAMDRKRLVPRRAFRTGPEDGEVDWLGGKGQSRLLRIRDSS